MPPRQFGQAAEQGTVDAGPMSLMDFLRLQNRFERVGHLGIAVRGRSGSALLFSRVPVRQPRTSLPIAVIVPQNSCPMTRGGGRRGLCVLKDSSSLPHLLVDGCYLFVTGYVALEKEHVVPSLHQLGDTPMEPLVLIGYGQLRSRLVKKLGYGPGNATVVGHPKDNARLSL